MEGWKEEEGRTWPSSCSRNAHAQKGKRKGVRTFFAPGARALRRASLDGRSQKLLTPLLVGIEMGKHYEWTRAMEDQSAPIPE
jgi:hypothetical protein